MFLVCFVFFFSKPFPNLISKVYMEINTLSLFAFCALYGFACLLHPSPLFTLSLIKPQSI